MVNPNHEGYHCSDPRSRRREAHATVTVRYSRARYRRGEMVIHAVYRHPDGRVDAETPRRLTLEDGVGPMVRKLWDTLFDEAAAAKQFKPRTLSIRLDPAGMPDLWRARVRTVAEVAGRELEAAVKGTALDCCPSSGVWTRTPEV